LKNHTNLLEDYAIIRELVAVGYSRFGQQLAAAQRPDGPVKGVGNYVFQR
jgi:hypothetical protein